MSLSNIDYHRKHMLNAHSILNNQTLLRAYYEHTRYHTMLTIGFSEQIVSGSQNCECHVKLNRKCLHYVALLLQNTLKQSVYSEGHTPTLLLQIQNRDETSRFHRIENIVKLVTPESLQSSLFYLIKA